MLLMATISLLPMYGPIGATGAFPDTVMPVAADSVVFITRDCDSPVPIVSAVRIAVATAAGASFDAGGAQMLFRLARLMAFYLVLLSIMCELHVEDLHVSGVWKTNRARE
jgi:hypothetical protein